MTPASLTPFEHDADEGFEVEADDLAAVWDLCVRGLLSVMTDPDAVGRGTRAWIEVDAGDRTELLVESLGELLYRFEVEGLLAAGVDHFELTETAAGVRARFRVLGEIHDPDRHPAGAGVKAVTHHGAALERIGDVWRARILLDL